MMTSLSLHGGVYLRPTIHEMYHDFLLGVLRQERGKFDVLNVEKIEIEDILCDAHVGQKPSLQRCHGQADGR